MSTPTRYRYAAEDLALAKKAVGFQELADGFGRASVLCAICTGIILVQAKEQLPHGQFEKWVEAKVRGISKRTAQRYLSLAQAFRDQVSPGVYKSLERLANEDPEKLTPTYIARAVGRLESITDGRTLTDLFRDFGILPAKQGGGAPALGAGGTPDPLGAQKRDARQLFFDFGRMAEWAVASEVLDFLEDLDEDEVGKVVTNTTQVLERLTGKKVVLK